MDKSFERTMEWVGNAVVHCDGPKASGTRRVLAYHAAMDMPTPPDERGRAAVGVNPQLIVNHLQARVPDLLAVYAFGSRIQGTHRPDSDLDLSVLRAGYADPLMLWECAHQLADLVGCPVDLLDLRAASTVMQHQIITTGQRWWQAERLSVGLFEAAVLSEKTALNEARAGLLSDIQTRGSVHGR